jgi:segregation and condensation protein B
LFSRIAASAPSAFSNLINAIHLQNVGVTEIAVTGSRTDLLKELQKKYKVETNSFHIEEVAGGFQLLSKKEFHPWLARVYARNVEVQVSSAMKETLAIAAYRQPITRADIEQIRGVNSSEVIRNLVEKNLLRIVGRDVTLGRPVLYGTTRKFLQIYGLKSLKDLPKTNEYGTPGAIPDEDVSSTEQ